MTANDLLHEIKTLCPSQLKSVFSFVYLLKHPEYMQAPIGETENIEPFVSEREALDFINFYAGKLINETR